MRNEPRRRRLGFTLLETMAAVAVLGIVYVTLARVGIVGLRTEGAADRRLRAALVADARLSDVEAQLLSGQTMSIGDLDEQAGEFAVRVSIAPFDLTLPAPPEAVAKRLRDAKGAGDAARAAAGDAPAASLFAPVAPGQPGPGRRISVRVSWTEGGAEDAVVRETYGLDLAAAAPLLEALQAAADAKAQSESSEAGTDTAPGSNPAIPNAPFPGNAPNSGPRTGGEDQ